MEVFFHKDGKIEVHYHQENTQGLFSHATKKKISGNLGKEGSEIIIEWLELVHDEIENKMEDLIDKDKNVSITPYDKL